MQKNISDHQGRNYTKRFFKKQWIAQKKLRDQKKAPEEDCRIKLVTLYEKEATVKVSRKCLRGPQAILLKDDEMSELAETIRQGDEEIDQQKKELARKDGVPIDDEEQRLLLLLWNAKNKLFVQATHMRAEKQPLINSQTIGSRLGTRGKEKIFQALRDRKPAVVKAINRYNKRYKEYTSKFPQNTPSDPSLFPLTYKVFSAFPLDHTFWNNGLYYQSKEP
ncbi:hypothetical protein PCASD_16455 [Puccinia coronata f. sp. avenae]|uniref:Uncharacterized protein n=1 Tax=Puccinia coronata f. sp. avenae TaxID=200324 RepID=A0A2N5U3K5_9BASI|nr:hypothetical protein PCASD_16455 [Puccinia coronata f. sp. avenae]